LLGLPLPARLMDPSSINCSNTVHSFCSPPVSAKQTGLPLPSHLTWILVENPPRLRRNASSAGLVGTFGSPFLHPVPSGPQQRSDVRVRWCHPRNVLSTGPHPAYLPDVVARQGFGPR